MTNGRTTRYCVAAAYPCLNLFVDGLADSQSMAAVHSSGTLLTSDPKAVGAFVTCVIHERENQ